MAAEAIGAVRIDFTANLASFSRSMKEMSTTVSVVQKRVSDAFEAIAKGAQAFERAGKDLTKGLTLPLAALATAAIRAADPTGAFTEKLKQLGVEAMVTLQPIGKALIEAFDAFEPTIRRAFSAVGVLADKFGQLSPETQRTIILIGAAVAAIGPLLVGVATVTKAIGVAGRALSSVLSVAKLFTFVVSPPMLIAIAAIGAALFGLELGSYFYDEFKIVQTTAAAAINGVENGWEYLQASFKIAVAAIREAWDSAMDFVLERNADVIDKVAAGLRYVKVISKEQFAEVTALTTKMRGASGDFDFKAEYQKIIRLRNENIAFNDAVYQLSVEQIDRDFAGKDRKGQSFADHFAADMGKVADLIGPTLQPLKDKFNEFLGAVDAYAAGSKDRAAAWSADAEGAKDVAKASTEAKDAMDRLREEAMRIRFELYPDEKLQADIAHIRELAAAFPEILGGPEVQAAIDKLTKGLEKPKKEMRTWRDEGRELFKGLGRDASRAFAEMATGAKVSFKEIVTSWIQMAIEMASQQWVFGPMFNALGERVFGPAGGSATAATPGALGANAPTASNAPQAAMSSSAYRAGMTTSINNRIGAMAASGGSYPMVQIIDQRSGGQAVQTSESRGPDGERLLRVLIRDEVGQMAGDGGMDRVLGPTYGTRRRPRTR